MPTITAKTANAAGNDLTASYYCRSGNVATIIFIDVDTAVYTVTAGNNDVIFFSVESGSKWTENADNSYYTYTAVVNGKIVENVMVADDVSIDKPDGTPAAGSGNGKFTYSSPNIVFTGADYDDGIITSLDTIAGSRTVQGVNKLSNENVQLGYSGGNYGTAGTFVVADDVKVFFLDDDGVITEGTINNVRRSTDDIVTYVLDQGQISYLFVQQYFEDNDQSAPGSGNLSGLSVSYSAPNLTVNFNAATANTTLTVVVQEYNNGVWNTMSTQTVAVTTGETNKVVNIGSLGSSFFAHRVVVNGVAFAL